MSYVPDVIVIDNFFTDFSLTKDRFKELPMYPVEEYNERFAQQQDWPGARSDWLPTVNPHLYSLFLAEVRDKLHNIAFTEKLDWNFSTTVHLRLSQDNAKDWIHTDDIGPYASEYTLLVYLSDTNLESGTNFYDAEGNLTSSVKFVQNRAVFFKAGIPHKGFGHHGSSISDGRLTLNTFISKVGHL